MPYRKGLVLQFGMVNVIVSIDGATEKDSALKSVCCGSLGSEHVPTPIRQDVVCGKCGPVSRTDLKKAREVGSGQYQVVDQQEIASVRDASQGATKKMMVITVHDAEEVAELTLAADGTYYVNPDGAGQSGAYSLLLRSIQRRPDKAFLLRYTPSSAVNTYQLKVFNGQLVVCKLVDPEQVKAGTFTDVIEPDTGLLEQMDAVIDQRTVAFDPAEYRNTYAENLDNLLSGKDVIDGEIAEKRKPTEKSVATAGVVDLSAQLAAMLGGSPTPDPAPVKTTKPRARKSA